MQKIIENFQNITNSFLAPQPVQCAGRNTEETEVDNPDFAKLDPHLHYDESQDSQEQLPPQMRGLSRRPPGFDGLMNNIKSITKKVEHIKGFKFDIVMAGSPNFHIINSWSIPGGAPAAPNPMQQQMPGKQQVAHYGLNVQYVGGSLLQLMEMQHPSFIMTGRWESSGKLECALIKRIRDNVQLRLSAAYPTGADLQYAQMYFDVDIEGDDYLHTLKYGTGLYSFNHMQTIGKNLVLGFEFMNLVERKLSFLNYAGKYTLNRKHQFFGQYLGHADLLSVAYLLNLKKRTHLVSEFNYSPQQGTTNTVLGYQQRFSNSEVIATINSKGKISTSLNIIGMSYALKLCAIADYMKDSYKFGYGLQIGQQQ